MEWEKCFPRGSFTGACTSLTQKTDVCLPLFPPEKEWRKVRERVLGSRWTSAYFQILLENCEANYVYDNFSNCFSCRITDQKIMKAQTEKPPRLLNPEQLGAGAGSSSSRSSAPVLLSGLSNPQEMLRNPTHANPNSSSSWLLKKTPIRHPKGHPAQPAGRSVLPSALQRDLDLHESAGTKLPPKLTSARYLCIFWTPDPGKAGSRTYRQTERPH